MPLDFARAAALFLASEQELASALGISLGDLRSFRNDSSRVPAALNAKLAAVLEERGRAMQRVGELLREPD